MKSRPHLYHVYSDESCVTQSDYMVIGAVVGKPCSLQRLAALIDHFPTPPGTMKWDKIRDHKFENYRRALDVFFEMNSRRELDFHALVLESKFLNHRRHSGGDKELGFGKFLYQLYRSLPARSRYGPLSEFVCFPDFRAADYNLNHLKEVLNSSLSTRHGGVTRPASTFKDIQWCNEADLPLRISSTRR